MRWLTCFLVLAACQEEPGSVLCTVGFRAVDGLCELWLPPLICEHSATRPVIGSNNCQRTGPTCTAGLFTPDPSGWGCREVLPSATCTGATKEKLGFAACEPVGDCTATFPPARATLFVDPSGMVDSTHFRSLYDALMAASPGAVIAVETGTYAVAFSTDFPLEIVGRCPAQVAFTTYAPDTTGILVSDGAELTVSGVTLTGHWYAAAVYTGAKLTLRDVVVEGNYTYGVTVSDAGSQLIVEDSVIRDTINDVGDDWAPGAIARAGGELIVRNSAVVGNRNAGLFIEGPGLGVVERSVVRGTLPASTGLEGVGIGVQDGGLLEISESAIVDNRDTGIMVFGEPSMAFVTSTVIRDTQPSIDLDHGRGVSVQDGGYARLMSSTLVHNHQIGLWIAGVDENSGAPSVADVVATAIVETRAANAANTGRGVTLRGGAQATFIGVAVVGNNELGILVRNPGTRLAISDSVVVGTTPDSRGDFGQGISCTEDASIAIADTAVLDNYDVGIQVSLGCNGTVSRSVVRGTSEQQADERTGMGILGGPGSRLDVAATEVRATEGVALAYIRGGGVVETSVVIENRVGVHADGCELSERGERPGFIGELDLVVVTDTKFIGNDTQIGSGVLPLPTPLSSVGD